MGIFDVDYEAMSNDGLIAHKNSLSRLAEFAAKTDRSVIFDDLTEKIEWIVAILKDRGITE